MRRSPIRWLLSFAAALTPPLACPSPSVDRSLGAAVYGRDKRETDRVAAALECGLVAVNDFGSFYLNQAMPFGGCKASGYGRFGGPEGLRGLCNVKAVIKDRFASVSTSIPAPVGALFPPPSLPNLTTLGR